MGRYKTFVKKYWFGICIFLILILSAFLRFYNYENRWGLAYDQARDVIVAREALKEHQIPLIGPFASAGQFVYGPQWFWILMGMVSVYPNSVITPWVIQTLLYVVAVWLMIIIGKDIQSKNFGLILGILTAISTAQIAQSINLTSPSMVGIFSVVSIFFFIRYIKTGLIKNAFGMAFMVATSINIHFQAIGLLVLIPMAIIFKKNSFKKIALLIIGVLIPFIPLIIFDLTNNFFESKNMMQYYFHDQYKISFDVLGRRWLTYVGVFWPKAWAHIIGGHVIVGYLITALLSIVILYKFVKKTVSKEWYIIILSFLLPFILLRYTRTPLFDSYLVFLHPFVLLLTGWTFFCLYKKNKIFGILIITIIVGLSISKDVQGIKSATNYTAQYASGWRKTLIEKYPTKKFAIYDYKYRSPSYTFPLVLFLAEQGRIADNGYNIGFGSHIDPSKRDIHREIKENKAGFILRDLSSSSSAELQKEEWAFVNPSAIYHSTVEWYREKK